MWKASGRETQPEAASYTEVMLCRSTRQISRIQRALI